MLAGSECPSPSHHPPSATLAVSSAVLSAHRMWSFLSELLCVGKEVTSGETVPCDKSSWRFIGGNWTLLWTLNLTLDVFSLGFWLWSHSTGLVHLLAFYYLASALPLKGQFHLQKWSFIRKSVVVADCLVIKTAIITFTWQTGGAAI